MVSTQLELTEEQVKALEALAQKRHLSLADLIRESIDSLLQAEPMPYTEEQKRRALAAVGRFKSGLGDLSRRLDDRRSDRAAMHAPVSGIDRLLSDEERQYSDQ